MGFFLKTAEYLQVLSSLPLCIEEISGGRPEWIYNLVILSIHYGEPLHAVL